MRLSHPNLPTIEHAGFLEELNQIPPYLSPSSLAPSTSPSHYTWSFYSGGIHGSIRIQESQINSSTRDIPTGWYRLKCYYFGQLVERPAQLKAEGHIEVRSSGIIAPSQGVVLAQLENDQFSQSLILREAGHIQNPGEEHLVQSFLIYHNTLQKTNRELQNKPNEKSMVNFRVSVGEQRSVYPFQLSPSVLDVTGRRVPIFYREAQERFADLLLSHRGEGGNTHIYTFGDVDYFGQFAIQEVGRLLGVKNIWNHEESGYQAVTQAEATLMGHEGPFVGQTEAIESPGATYLLSGWNGIITHLSLFDQLYQKENLNIYFVDVMVSETAKAIAGRYGVERVLLIKPGTDILLALSVAHQVLTQHKESIPQDFLNTQADSDSLNIYLNQAKNPAYAPEKIAADIAAAPEYIERIEVGIKSLAKSLSSPKPAFHFQGKGPAQTAGSQAYSQWNNLWAILGKLGYNSDGETHGGIITLPSYESEHTQAQHLAQDHFFGRIPIDTKGTQDAAMRMGLPSTAYGSLLELPSLTLSEYVQSTPETQELLICVGKGLETQLFQSPLWQEKLISPSTTLVIIDPQPGPMLLSYAALCLPTPPKVSQARLIQNADGELTLALPRRSSTPETYSEATILYDAMDTIVQQLSEFEDLQLEHPDLAVLLDNGYLSARFGSSEYGGHLERIEGEVSRPILWDRIQTYLSHPDSVGTLYCRPETSEGIPFKWDDIVGQGQINYRYKPKSTTHFAQDIYRNPKKLFFRSPPLRTGQFGTPDFHLLTGASLLSDHKPTMRYAIKSYHQDYFYHSPETQEEPTLFVSEILASQYQLQAGQKVSLSEAHLPPLDFSIQPTSRLKGKTLYLSSHRTHSALSGQYYRLAYRPNEWGINTLNLSLESIEEKTYVG